MGVKLNVPVVRVIDSTLGYRTRDFGLDYHLGLISLIEYFNGCYRKISSNSIRFSLSSQSTEQWNFWCKLKININYNTKILKCHLDAGFANKMALSADDYLSLIISKFYILLITNVDE